MIIEKFKQTKLLLNEANRILIVVGSSYSYDALVAGLALTLGIKKSAGKDVKIVSNINYPQKLNFLPSIQSVEKSISKYGGNIVLRIEGEKDILDELWYEEKNGNVDVCISPKDGKVFVENNIKLYVESPKPDLIFTIGVDSLNYLAELYDGDPEIFYKIPKINISNDLTNEQYGELNIVDSSFSTMSEMIESFLEINELIFDEDIATLLFSGILLGTDRFQNIKTKPNSFFIASKLLKLNARQDEIIKHLYKTKSFDFLKVFGRLLSHVEVDAQIGLVYSTLTKNDLNDLIDTDLDFSEIFQELINTFSNSKIIFCLIEENGKNNFTGILYSNGLFDIENLAISLNAKYESSHILEFSLSVDKNIEEQTKEVKNKIYNCLKSSRQI